MPNFAYKEREKLLKSLRRITVVQVEIQNGHFLNKSQTPYRLITNENRYIMNTLSEPARALRSSVLSCVHEEQRGQPALID
jgi:hypothetical protein